MAHPEHTAPLLRLLVLASRTMTDGLQQALVADGFDDHRLAHHQVMPNIPDEGIRLTGLAERAGMTKQAMAELVADLERLGYLRREPDPADGRAKLIRFTQRGQRAVEAALRAFEDMEADLAARLGPTAARSLRRSLLHIAGDGSAPPERPRSRLR